MNTENCERKTGNNTLNEGTHVKTFEEVLNEDGVLFYKSVGCSMLPLIREGRDYICLHKRPAGRLKKYDVVLYCRPNIQGRGRYVLHRILRVNPDGTYWIVGDHCISGETVPEEQVFGVLTAVKRGKRMISMACFGCRLYTALWCAPYPLRFFILRCIWFMRRVGGKILRKLHLR